MGAGGGRAWGAREGSRARGRAGEARACDDDLSCGEKEEEEGEEG